MPWQIIVNLMMANHRWPNMVEAVFGCRSRSFLGSLNLLFFIDSNNNLMNSKTDTMYVVIDVQLQKISSKIILDTLNITN